MANGPDHDFSKPIVESAARVAQQVRAQALMAFVDAVPDLDHLLAAVQPPTALILVVRDARDELRLKGSTVKTVTAPDFSLTRMGQIKMATLLAFSQRLLSPGDVIVFLTGVHGKALDTLVTTQVGQEYELFQSVDQPKLTEHIRRVVFQRVLTLALEVAYEGREGKPLGALFVVGSHKELEPFCRQNIINPFRGYPERERNILDDAIRETVKEFCSIDGAFIIKGNGVIVSAGTTLHPTLAGEDLPQGLGARHAVAAAITANTRSVALTVSESTGDVRIWRRGKMITEIEKGAEAPRTGLRKPMPDGG
jgi:DNA integrity scanning protein DisA with diadenylate cyclase activity